MAEHEKMIICLVIVAVHYLFLWLAIAKTFHCIEMALMKFATKIEILKLRARDKYGN